MSLDEDEVAPEGLTTQFPDLFVWSLVYIRYILPAQEDMVGTPPSVRQVQSRSSVRAGPTLVNKYFNLAARRRYLDTFPPHSR